MFEKILRFFVENYKINYTLFFLLFALGIYSYSHIPKEISPEIEPDSVTVRGHYSGASVDILNKMVVQEIENETKNINGVTSITSAISPGSFSVILEIDKSKNKIKMTQEIQDAISLIMPDLPSDMDEPLVRGVAHSRSIMHISIMSDKFSNSKLKDIAKKFKNRLLNIEHISDVTIFGDSDRIFEITIDEKKVLAYGLSLQKVLSSLSELSYIFPMGKIEDKKEQFYISGSSENILSSDLENTILNIDDLQINLKDIATITKGYEQSSTLASMNAQNSITLAISQDPKGDAIKISKEINTLLKKMKIKDVDFKVRRDQSVIIKDRLNIVISNIILGICLITFLTLIFINIRMAIIIALGIPTSFIMGAIYFYFSGHSININSLVGVLIAIGIIVDDAIVVSENIQQYIEKGYSNAEAAILGTKEMAKPVTIASLTTLFSFIPLLMLSGKIGEIIQLIPIAFSALVVASLIESFIFLPIHAVHIISPKSRTLSWTKVNTIYFKILNFFIRYQKSFLLVFFIAVPLFIYYGVEKSRFQMFQAFDASSINITFKASPTTTLEESLSIIQTIEKDILKHKDKFYAKNVSSTAGYRRTATGTTEMYPYVGYISLELYKKKPSNFLDKYITPYLSLYYDDKDRIRDVSSHKISRDLRIWLKKQDYKKKFNLNDLMVVEKRMGYVKADIRIGIISDDYKKAIKAVRDIEKEFANIKGLKYFGDNIKMGADEIKIKVNAYGEELGVTKSYIGKYVSDLYLEKKNGVIFDDKELMDIRVKSINKDDIENFYNLEIPLKDGSLVMLKDICEFKKVKSLERLVKDDGETNFYVYANVNADVITSGEVVQKIQPLINRLKNDGIRLKFKGEREQKRVIKTEMILASSLSIVLIFMSILYLFNSLRETFIVMSVIPLSFLGVYIGHFIMQLNISLPSLIGVLGLAGVIVNDGIIMMSTIKLAKNKKDVLNLASKRFRPIVLTSITTVIGLASLIFYPSAQAVTFQPLAVTLGFGLIWGTVLNLLYLPIIFNFTKGYLNE